MKAKEAITLFLCMMFSIITIHEVLTFGSAHAAPPPGFIDNSLHSIESTKTQEKEMFIVTIDEEQKTTLKKATNIPQGYQKITLSDVIIYYKNVEELEKAIGNKCIKIEIIKGPPPGYDDYCYCVSYNKKNRIITATETGRDRSYIDLKMSFKNKQIYNLNTKKFNFYKQNTSSGYGKEMNEEIITHLFGNGQVDNITKVNSIYIPYDSTFSVERRLYKKHYENDYYNSSPYGRNYENDYHNYSSYGRNYIYRTGITLNIKKNLLYAGNTVTLLIGNKQFKVNFETLEKSKKHMPLLKKETFRYGIYLDKNETNYTLHFMDKKNENINQKTVKSIGIVPCKGNNSNTYNKEEKLKKDKEGNFTYNISEQLNNKCNIPYKINVYYTDGSKETGEYYILFNY